MREQVGDQPGQKQRLVGEIAARDVGAAGNCAWGSFQRPANPVLRDLSERVIIASKGRFDRAVDVKRRAKRGLPSVSTMSRDEFMEATVDVWEIPPESAARVGHPAPFPIALPERLLHMNTYAGELVLDPSRHQCTWKGKEVHLTVTEFLLLKSLAERPGHVKNRDQLMAEAHIVVDDSTITSHIKRIRGKFAAVDFGFACIDSVYGMGYRWRA